MALVASWREKLRWRHHDVIDNTEIGPVLEYMLSKQGFSQSQVQDIQCGRTRTEKASKLLNLLHDLPDEHIQIFIQGLKDTGQGHVAHLITGDGSIMTPDHKNLLLTCRLDITRNLNAQELLCYLRSVNVLTAYDVEQIKAGLTDQERNQTLLDVLARKPDAAFHKFIEGLRQTSQPHIAGLLQNGSERDYQEEIKNLWNVIKHQDEKICNQLEEKQSMEQNLSKSEHENKKLRKILSKRDKEMNYFMNHLKLLRLEAMEQEPNSTLLQDFDNMQQDLACAQARLCGIGHKAAILEATKGRFKDAYSFDMARLKRPIMDFDVGSPESYGGYLTGVLALQGGNSLVVHHNPQSTLPFTVLKVTQNKHKLVRWFSSRDVSGLIKVSPYVFILHQQGQVTKCHEDQITSDGSETFKLNMASLGQGDYVNDSGRECLVIPDVVKGRVCIYDLNEQRLDVVLSGLREPTSVSVDVTTGFPQYIVTEKDKNRLGLYNRHWKLIRYIISAKDNLKQPVSTAQLPNGNFLLADKGTNEITEFDNHGVYVRTILDVDLGIQSPVSVSYSHPYLWVTSCREKQAYNVKRFTLYNT